MTPESSAPPPPPPAPPPPPPAPPPPPERIELAAERQVRRTTRRTYRRTTFLLPAALGLILVVLLIGATWLVTNFFGRSAGIDAAGRHSIAVLAFKGPPGDADGDDTARDVAADLIAELARSPDLRVVSSQSSFQLSAAHMPLADVGKQLRSRYLVDGSVRRTGEQLRINVELLDSLGGQVVWSSSHVVERTTIATTRQEIVRRIAGTLQSRVARTEERRAPAQPPKTLDVFVLTARGKARMQRYDASGVRDARALLSQALAIDPEYAPAWAYLGMVDTIDIGQRLTGERGREHAPEMIANAERAIALQPDLTVAYVALSQAHGLVGNLDAALGAAQQCFRLSPNDAGCYYVLGATQLRLGDDRPAVHNLEQALDRNPLPPAFLPAFYATALWANRRLEDAVRVTGGCLAQAPQFTRCRLDRIAALVELGRIDEAREEAARVREQAPALTASDFGNGFSADRARALIDRRVAAATAVGFPAQ